MITWLLLLVAPASCVFQERYLLTLKFWRPRASLLHYNGRGLDFWGLLHGSQVAVRFLCFAAS